MAHARFCQLTSLLDLQLTAQHRPSSHGRGFPGTARPAGRCPPEHSHAESIRRAERMRCCAAMGDNNVLGHMDANQLQTALQIAVESEDYAKAQKIKSALKGLLGEGKGIFSWEELGTPEWLADRAAQYGLRFPTEVQARAADVIRGGQDCIVQSETGSGKTLSFLIPALSKLDYPPQTPLERFQGPQCVVLVPTRELGVQIAMLVYKLFGGSVNAGIPGAAGNMFAYQGPRGLKVRGVLDKQEVLVAKNSEMLRSAHVLVATPPALAEVMAAPGPLAALQHARFLIVDECDACFQEHSEAMETLLTTAAGCKPKPTIVFVGATVQDSLATTATEMGWMEDPVTVAVGQGGMPAGLRHAYIESEQERKIAVLCRQIRADLKAQGEDAPAARVIVFTESEEQAAAVSEPLRNALWGEHKISVLLPGGQEPIKALHAFRDNQASLLVATPAAARGLDLPAVSFIYNLGVPVDHVDYLHRAGRTGRIGSCVSGKVMTVVTPEEQPKLQQLAQRLEIDIRQQEQAPPSSKGGESQDEEERRRQLEDLYYLY